MSPDAAPTAADLSGQSILVTGAAGGIGGAAARLCVGQGARVVLVDRAPTIEKRVGDLGELASFRSCDVSRRAAVAALAREIGPVDGLVDCAAICPEDDWLADDWDEALDDVIAVNIKGPLNLARAFFPAMAERGKGRMVFCGSVAGWMGGLRSGPHYYAFSKGGLHAFVRWLSRRGAPRGVLVNGIAPGAVDTPMIAGRGYEREAFPLGRMAQPEEIAAVAVATNIVVEGKGVTAAGSIVLIAARRRAPPAQVTRRSWQSGSTACRSSGRASRTPRISLISRWSGASSSVRGAQPVSRQRLRVRTTRSSTTFG